MTDKLQKIIDEIANNIDTYPQDLVAASLETEKLLNKVYTQLLDDMDYTNGMLAATQRNFELINQVDTTIKAIFTNSPYLAGLTEYARGMRAQVGLVGEYFGVLGKDVSLPAYQTVIRNIQANAISRLTEDAISNAFAKPLKDLLNQSITTGTTRKEVIDSVTNFVKGTPELDGKLVKYVKQISNDAFAAVDRQTTKYLADQLGLGDWWLYAGGTVKDSRVFCIERHGRYFHRLEIESWVNLTWQGKAPVNEGTIFSLLGGYNCQHIAMPVSIEIVPQVDIERNIANGNYTP
jgi:hypothetical protein